MVDLYEVDQGNLYDCLALCRESSTYVGDAAFVLAEAYVFRQNSSAYAIADGDSIIGLVVILDRPREDDMYYSFTDFFIADDFQGKGYGHQAVEAILRKFGKERKREKIEIQVHNSNQIAEQLFESHGFIKTGKADWDESFYVLQKALDI